MTDAVPRETGPPDSAPPGVGWQLAGTLSDLLLRVTGGRVVASWAHGRPAPVALPVIAEGSLLADLVHPGDDLPLPPGGRATVRLLFPVGPRWFEVGGVADGDGGCWLALRDVHERVDAERDL